MFVSLKKKIIYFHISRTAGTSITMMLESMFYDERDLYKEIFNAKNLKHYTAAHVRIKWGDFVHLDPYPFKHITPSDAAPFLKLAGIDCNDFFCFTVVRNPYTRFVSQLKYLNLNHEKTIDHYIDIYGNLDTPAAGYWYKKQVDYLKDPLTKNFSIYKFEELDKLYDKFKSINWGHSPTIVHHNKYHPILEKNTTDIILTDTQKKKIYNMFKEDFDTFGYQPDFQ